MHRFADVVHATSVPGPTVASWLDRGIVCLDERDEDTVGSGSHRRFSKARIYQIALTHSLTKIGLNLLRSADAAAVFANRSDPGRERGELFPTGRTLLIVSPTTTTVVNADAALGNYGVAVAIDVNKVVERVDAALGQGRRRAA
jgi:hypothetical protein